MNPTLGALRSVLHLLRNVFYSSRFHELPVDAFRRNLPSNAELPVTLLVKPLLEVTVKSECTVNVVVLSPLS